MTKSKEQLLDALNRMDELADQTAQEVDRQERIQLEQDYDLLYEFIDKSI